MVYPKHQALDPSARKKVKTSTTTNDTPTTTTIDIASKFSDQANESAVICEMLGNCYNDCYKYVNNQDNWRGKCQEHSDLNKTVSELLHHIKSLEQRLEDTKDQIKASNEDSAELNQAVGTFVDTADILESHLGSIEGRVSSIEHLIIRSRKRKLKEADPS